MDVLVDESSRRRAATATDRNIVVTAGAGTGKTTLLVDRLVHLLLDEAHPYTVGEIVALTFTNKAANEMKARLRAALLQRRDHDAAARALADLEQSQIGTIHSFAAHLLRLYPLEGGVDPAFQQDEGMQFDEQFARQWGRWLEAELGSSGCHHDAWRQILSAFSLSDLEALARSLCGELVPLEDLASCSEPILPETIRSWLLELAVQAAKLVSTHEKRTLIVQQLDMAAQCLREAATHGVGRVIGQPLWSKLDREAPSITQGWSEEDYQRAKQILSVARGCWTLNDAPLRTALERLVPFAVSFRRAFVASGYISFDGLLARCRAMLRDYPDVRRQLKARYRSILVDEFQDTDPVQYEIILYLAEAEGREAAQWHDLRLEPGKLFIVGDAKQSIYAFRRADIEAYDRVVHQQILAQEPPGEAHKLQTNFRSHRRLLGSLNAFFSGLFPPVAHVGLQPQHDPLEPKMYDEAVLEGERVEIRLVTTGDDERDAEAATRAEAEELARWLADDVLGKEQIIDRGTAVSVQPGHVAVLFRTLGPLREYVEAFRRYAIPCQAEGERHFYERQEVVDTVNLLRAVADPSHPLALVGVLRSVVGGATDRDVAILAQAGLLDYRIVDPPTGCDAETAGAFDRVRQIYGVLRRLHGDLPRRPLPDVLPGLFAQIPCLELAAASMDRDQAVGNVLKLRDMAAELAHRPTMTFARLVRELTRRITDVPPEAELSMEDETTRESQAGAVRCMSMHKAKGLEFPVVVLAGLHRVPNRQGDRAFVHHDWSTGITGIRAGRFQTIGGLYTAAKMDQRRWAEQSRLLYVGMTRAKRKLVLSAGLPSRPQSDSFLAYLASRFDLDLGALGKMEGEVPITCGTEELHVAVRLGRLHPVPRPVEGSAHWQTIDRLDAGLETRLVQRRRRVQEEAAPPLFLSPTMLQEQIGSRATSGPRRAGSDATAAARIGTLAHRLLERWDFSRMPSNCGTYLMDVLERELGKEPPDTRQALRDELTMLLTRFVSSPLYRDLQRASIIGREVPFLIPWDSGRQVMSGTIDVLYRLNGALWIADYKTDQVEAEEITAHMERYRAQAESYMAAIALSLGEPCVTFQFVFLRPGLTVAIQQRSM